MFLEKGLAIGSLLAAAACTPVSPDFPEPPQPQTYSITADQVAEVRRKLETCQRSSDNEADEREAVEKRIDELEFTRKNARALCKKALINSDERVEDPNQKLCLFRDRIQNIYGEDIKGINARLGDLVINRIWLLHPRVRFRSLLLEQTIEAAQYVISAWETVMTGLDSMISDPTVQSSQDYESTEKALGEAIRNFNRLDATWEAQGKKTSKE